MRTETVITKSGSHEAAVADMISELESEGFEVFSVRQTSYRTFWFGENVTRISYS